MEEVDVIDVKTLKMCPSARIWWIVSCKADDVRFLSSQVQMIAMKPQYQNLTKSRRVDAELVVVEWIEDDGDGGGSVEWMDNVGN